MPSALSISKFHLVVTSPRCLQKCRWKVLKSIGKILENPESLMQLDVKPIYEFGPFQLNVADRRLQRAESVVLLTPKLFELLLFLLENSGRAISKDEFLTKVWPDSFVSEENLSRHILTLRKTLNAENGESKYIETLPRFGYRFTESVTRLLPADEPVPSVRAPGLVEDWPDSLAAPLGELRQTGREEMPGSRPPTEANNESRFPTKSAADKLEVSPPFMPVVRKSRQRLALVLLLVGVGSACVIAWLVKRQADSAESNATPQILPLTSFLNRDNYPAFSPDDKMLAFTWDGEEGKNTDIYVKLLDAETPLRLTTDPAADISPAWSPDGRFIAFVRLLEEGASIYLVPTLGGPERELIAGIWSAGNGVPAGRLAWSPNGKSLVFAGRVDQKKANLQLFLYDFDRQEKSQLTDSPEDDRSPVISPDGQTLAFIRGLDEIFVMPATGGQARQLTFENKRIFGLAWAAHSRELIFSSARAGNPTFWKIMATGGQPEALLPGGEQVSNLTVAHQRNQLVYAQNLNNQNIWQLELPTANANAPEPPVKLISSTRQDMQPEFSLDGQHLAFVSTRSGWREVWFGDNAGKNLLQLTHFNGPFVGSPSFSPDGKQVAFDCTYENDQRDIYVVNRNGGPPHRLTFENAWDAQPSWSRDGQWIYFSSLRSGSEQIWKMPSAGGSAVQVTKTGGRQTSESPDGKYLYFSKKPDEPGIWRIPTAGGAETQILVHARHGGWALWEQGIYFVNPNTKPHAIPEFFQFASTQTSRLTTLEKFAFTGLSVSPDGRKLLWSQVDRSESDLILLKHFH
jgi:Tol biopolymer transport system component/DNA-binding winged helix-turn-helix (wHTH) protein